VKIIEPNTPYVLIIWSTYENQFSQTLFDEFKGRFKDYAPIECCSLDKQEIQDIRKKGGNVIQSIREKLKDRLTNFNSFNLFLLWESIVNDSCGESVNSLINSSYRNTNDVNKELRTIIKKLANAYLGRRIKSADSKTIQRSAMFTFNDLFKESIEKGILSSGLIEELDFTDTNAANSVLIAKLNSKLLFEADVKNDRSPGSVYILPQEDQEKISAEIKQKTHQTWLENIVIKKEIKESIQNKITQERGSSVEEVELNKLTKDLIKELINSSILVEVEISPICDYAQEKRILSRSVKGCLFPYGLVEEKCIKTKTDYLYISPIFEYNSVQYKLILDLRLFSAYYFTEKNESVVILKIRHQLLAEIQINISKHVSRTGLTFLDERDL